jgi:hypothetical protein
LRVGGWALLLWVATLTSWCAAETLTGQVRLTGSAPRIPVRVVEDGLGVCSSQARPMQALILGTNQAVRNAVVYLATTQTGKEAVREPAILDIRDCEFVPRIQIARTGGELLLKNSDPLLHVVHVATLSSTNGPAPFLDVAAPYAGFERKSRLPEGKMPMLLKATSDHDHDWMQAYIAVLPQTCAALTDADGNFTIRDIPPGTHRLHAWHEVLGVMTKEVRVPSNRTTSVELVFDREPQVTAASPKQSD